MLLAPERLVETLDRQIHILHQKGVVQILQRWMKESLSLCFRTDTATIE